MSYCVNCGVELDRSLEACPLCNAPVINPRELELELEKAQPSFPTESGNVEAVKRKDMGILMTTIAVATAVTCGLLNLLIFDNVPWSLTIVGLCVVLWVIMIPVVINTRQSVYVSILFDGAAVILYLYMISYMTLSREWFWELGIPITLLVVAVAELFIICVNKLPKSILLQAFCFITAAAIICIGLEIFIDRYLYGEILLSWSAIVLTICVIVDIAIVTILSRRRLRNAVRKRLHF